MKKRSRLAALACLILALMTAGAAPAEEQAEASFDRVGSIVTFGRYEQDGDEENGPEGIRWIVLDTQEGKSLLLSLYGLDAAPYHPKSKNIIWKDCALRKWLNGEFLQTAFTKEEQQAILTTKVDNGRKQGWKKWKRTKGGKNTKDRVFLLSVAEAIQYLSVSRNGSDDPLAPAELTEYALRKGAGFTGPGGHRRADGDPACGYWWLRSPGYVQVDAAYVNGRGTLVEGSVIWEEACVRPAFWLDLGAAGNN